MDHAPVLLALSLDAVLRDGLTTGTLLDVPGALAVRYDVDERAGVLDRAVLDVGGALDTARIPLDDGCVACTLRSDLLPTLRRLACRRPAAVVLAPPPTTEPAPLLAMLADTPAGLRAGAVLVAAHAGGLEVDLLDDALLVEAGLARSPDDRRAVGEVLAHQLEAADAVLLDTAPAPPAGTLLRHLVPAATTVGVLHETSPADLLAVRRPADDPRGDLRRPSPTGAADADGVWTRDLSSWRPLHRRGSSTSWRTSAAAGCAAAGGSGCRAARSTWPAGTAPAARCRSGRSGRGPAPAVPGTPPPGSSSPAWAATRPG